jgi:hypothetical protein
MLCGFEEDLGFDYQSLDYGKGTGGGGQGTERKQDKVCSSSFHPSLVPRPPSLFFPLPS